MPTLLLLFLKHKGYHGPRWWGYVRYSRSFGGGILIFIETKPKGLSTKQQLVKVIPFHISCKAIPLLSFLFLFKKLHVSPYFFFLFFTTAVREERKNGAATGSCVYCTWELSSKHFVWLFSSWKMMESDEQHYWFVSKQNGCRRFCQPPAPVVIRESIGNWHCTRQLCMNLLSLLFSSCILCCCVVLLCGWMMDWKSPLAWSSPSLSFSPLGCFF